MRKNTKTLVISAALLAVLGGAYGIVTLTQNTPKTAEPEATSVPSISLLARDKTDLIKFELASPTETLTFTVDGDGNWTNIEKPNLLLKQTDISSMAGYAANCTANGTILEEAADMNEYGLGETGTVVTSWFADGSTEKLIVGTTTPSGDKWYVCTPNSAENKGVYTVTSYVGGLFNRKYADLIDAKLPAVDLANTRYLYFYNGNDVFEGAYSEESSTLYQSSNIILSSPMRGKSVYLENFSSFVLEPLAEVTLTDIVDLDPNDLSKYGLDKPRIDLKLDGITVDEEGAKTGDFSFGFSVGATTDSDSSVYVKINTLPTVFKLDASVVAPLFTVNLYRMMDRFVYMVYINNVDEIILKTQTTSYTAKINPFKEKNPSTDAEYDEIAPEFEGNPIDAQLFREFYQIIIGLTVDSPIENFTPTGNPYFSITYNIMPGNDEIFVTLNFYEYDDNFFAIQQISSKDGDLGAHFVINKNIIVNKVIPNTEVLKNGGELIR